MKRLAVAALAIVVLCGCSPEMWIPVDTIPRGARPAQGVQYLETPPEKPFTVVGIITPPEDEYETEAAAIKAMRTEAAKHGANAFFIESRTETSGWEFSVNPLIGASGGNKNRVAYRAKAIIWK